MRRANMFLLPNSGRKLAPHNLSTNLPTISTKLRVTSVLGLGLLAFGAQAETPSRLCARVGTDDTARPVPASLANEVNRLFDTRMPASIVEKATVFRCFDGHVLVCTAGANLPCGKANVSRINPGAAAWCRDHPGAASVPAFATGHDTIYEWRCHGGQAEAFRQVDQVDARGFFARYWKQLR